MAKTAKLDEAPILRSALTRLFAKNLARLRAAKGYTQTSFARASHGKFNQTTVNRIEAATMAPTLDKIEELLEVLKVPAWQLFLTPAEQKAAKDKEAAPPPPPPANGLHYIPDDVAYAQLEKALADLLVTGKAKDELVEAVRKVADPIRERNAETMKYIAELEAKLAAKGKKK